MDGKRLGASKQGLLAKVSGALGLTSDDIIGLSGSIALRLDDRGGERYFLSGHTSDILDRISSAFELVLEESAPDGDEVDSLIVVDELWVKDGALSVGYGPAVIHRDEVGPDSGARLVHFRNQDLSRSRSDAWIERLREQLGELPNQLDIASVDWGIVTAILGTRAARPAIEEIAVERNSFGRFLLNAADWMDDERLDQLGDAYVRAGRAWSAVGRGGTDVDAVARLESYCVDRMESLGRKPIRFMF